MTPPDAAAPVFVTADEWAATAVDRNVTTGILGTLTVTMVETFNPQPGQSSGGGGGSGGGGSSGGGAASVDISHMVTKVWTFKNAGGEPFYSSPIGPINLTAPGRAVPVPVVIVNGWDWYTYALDAMTGEVVHSHAAGDTRYGRSQAADVNGDGKVEIFSPSHEGYIWSLTDQFALRWKFASLYEREGSGTLTGVTSTTISDATKNWAANSFTRSATDPLANAFVAVPSVGYTGNVKATPGGSTLTVSPAFTTLPAIGAAYEITPRWSSDIIFMHAGTLVKEGATWFLYVTGFDNMVRKVNASTGALVWKYATLENIEPYPLIADLDNDGQHEIIAVSIDGKLRAFSQAGALLWSSAAPGPMDAFANAANLDATGSLEVIVSGRDGRVHVVNGATGVQRDQSTFTGSWNFEAIDSSSVPIKLKDGTARIFVGGDSGTVWCFDQNGNTKWHTSVVPNAINSSPIFHDVDGDGEVEVIIADMRGTVWILRAATGEVVGRLYHKGGIEGMPLYADIDKDGRMEMVVTTTDGYVVAYRFPYGAPYVTTFLPGNARWRGYS